MKTVISSTNKPTFTPGAAGVGTLDFTTQANNGGFAFNRLLAVLDQTTNTLIYAQGQAGYGGTFSGNVLTLAANTAVASGYASGDTLTCFYDTATATVSLDAPTATAPAQGWPNAQRFVTSGTVTAANLKASAGTLGSVVFAPSAGITTNCYLKIYDKATAPVVNDVPKLVFFLAWSTTSPPTIYNPPVGIKFSTGISIAIVTTSSDATFTNPGSDFAVANIAWA